MARRRRAVKREIIPDARYHNTMVTKFINVMMYGGKRSAAEGIIYECFDMLQNKAKADPLQVFQTAIDNVKPTIEVRSKRVGGATYQVPSEVRPERQEALSMRWIITAARGRKGRPMSQRLYEEINDAANNRGGAVKKREDTHKMADANKAFAHFKW